MKAPVDCDARYLRLATQIGGQSTDRSTRVGCVIAGSFDQKVLALGWNGFPKGVRDLDERHARPAKYTWTIHAEIAAICAAARSGVSIYGATMFVPWFPCAECARAIVQSGIGVLVAYRPDLSDPKWGEDFWAADAMLREAGVEVQLYETPKDDCQ